LLPKDLGNRKKFRSVMGVMVLTRHGAAFVSLPKEKILIDFERAKELIDEKAIADAPVAFYKGEGSEKCWPFWSFYKMERFIYKCK
jgi:DNA topoisomerase-1